MGGVSPDYFKANPEYFKPNPEYFGPDVNLPSKKKVKTRVNMTQPLTFSIARNSPILLFHISLL